MDYKEIMKTEDFWQEAAILTITEKICELMKINGITRQELARKVRYHPEVLDGVLNDGTFPDGQIMDILDIASLFFALGYTFIIKEKPCGD